MKKNTAPKPVNYYVLYVSLLIATSLLINACSKENSTSIGFDTYTSLEDFYSKNKAEPQSYTIDINTGGSFTTAQGTKVTIPSDALIDETGNAVTGNATIEFKDIYKQSEMLLSDVPTTYYGIPLKSAGEFFIKARAGNTPLKLVPSKKIEILQPLNNALPDSAMLPFIGNVDNGFNWNLNDSLGFASVTPSLSGYVFSLYRFNAPVSNGTWCNSDNMSFFQAYPITTLTLHPTDADSLNTDVFLIFSDVNSMVHVYKGAQSDYPYNYAPKGLKCTIVAVGVKDEKLYSSFTPITIGDNETVNFTLSVTTTDAFKNQLKALDK